MPFKRRRERSSGRYQEPVSRSVLYTVCRKKRGVQRGPSKSTAVPRTRITNLQNGLVTTAYVCLTWENPRPVSSYPFRFSHFLIPRRYLVQLCHMSLVIGYRRATFAVRYFLYHLRWLSWFSSHGTLFFLFFFWYSGVFWKKKRHRIYLNCFQCKSPRWDANSLSKSGGELGPFCHASRT